MVASFPVKHNWWETANIELIKKSCIELITSIFDSDYFDNKFKVIWLPFVGCGNGHLSWEKEVKPVISKMLDDRFYIVSIK
jgi:hypothetical protein